MRYVFLIAVLFSVGLSGCKHDSMYEKEVAILDSTKIVLQVKLNELKKTEQSIQNLQFEKFEAYNSFLKSNVKDTIAKPEGNALQLFVKAGATISEYNKVKADLIRQIEVSVVQIQKLSADLKENNVQHNVAQSYYNSEKGHADELIRIIEQNIKALNLSINNYRNSVSRTEEYIKKINSGQLPNVVTDSTIE